MNKESGQVTIFAALMLIVFVSVAAFCMNAAYAFHQHTQMQAKVDSTTLYAAGTGCDPSLVSLPSGLVIGTPVAGSPYAPPNVNSYKYCEGTYTLPGTSLFGKIVPAWQHISVQAVARHGGSTEKPFAFLGLDPNPGSSSQNCSVEFTGSNTVNVTGNILVNSTLCDAANKGYVSGSANPTISGGNYFVAPPSYYDPFKLQVPTSGGNPISSSCGGSCITYTASITGVTLLPSNVTANKVYLNPNGSTPGVFLVPGNFSPSTLVVTNSVVILESAANLPNTLSTGTDWEFNSPVSGDYTGYAVYQATPCQSISTFHVAGQASFSYNGLLDLSCMNITIDGNGSDSLIGGIVGNTVTLSGSSSGVAFQPSQEQPSRGAFLVQ